MADNGSGQLFHVVEQYFRGDKYFPRGQNRALWVDTIFFVTAVDILPEGYGSLFNAGMGKQLHVSGQIVKQGCRLLKE